MYLLHRYILYLRYSTTLWINECCNEWLTLRFAMSLHTDSIFSMPSCMTSPVRNTAAWFCIVFCICNEEEAFLRQTQWTVTGKSLKFVDFQIVVQLISIQSACKSAVQQHKNLRTWDFFSSDWPWKETISCLKENPQCRLFIWMSGTAPWVWAPTWGCRRRRTWRRRGWRLRPRQRWGWGRPPWKDYLLIFSALKMTKSYRPYFSRSSTGCPICSCTWVGLTLIRVFHHLAQLPSHFWQIPIIQGRIGQTIEQSKFKSSRPIPRADGTPCKKGLYKIPLSWAKHPVITMPNDVLSDLASLSVGVAWQAFEGRKEGAVTVSFTSFEGWNNTSRA